VPAAQSVADKRARCLGRDGFGVLVAAFMFNLGQGVLRPALPLYLRETFGANYRMVTVIPTVFGAGKWLANLPTGYLLDRIGRRPLMMVGLVVIASSDIASALAPFYNVFLGIRGVAGIGWAMFATVATTMMVDRAARRGRAVSLLLMAESLGLLVGSVGGGWLYSEVGRSVPFVFEAVAMLFAAMAVGWLPLPAPASRGAAASAARDRHGLRTVVRVPGVVFISAINATLVAVQTGVVVFLFPLYLVQEGHLTPEVVGYFVGLSVLGRLVALWLAGSLPDHWSRPRVLGFGLLGYGIVLSALAGLAHPLLLGVWSLLLGGTAGFIAGLPTVIVGERVDPALQGIAVGWLRTLADAGMIIGPLVMGGLADAVTLTTPFICAGALICASAWPCYRVAPVPLSATS
jgi:MFS transporter, ACDE family, multidrug resistance protein